ncbi:MULTISPECIES: DUF2922 domain-containing protein [Allobacillus]|uniref:DUF2922 domain-containing protein n=1 Tax=Allobacillus halotolerans TaxID=570278 RepID=A0ABS6GNL4_9BACI|nr:MULTISPECIES: DUF2922 domain-containing protein [Allobacillus]MBU6080545.1 DUF2922 domain-containing protein [Allobacillus halotolerans]TSJ69392.1 DUF2922 domain-containing protein [Allobacillus sp. SKP2-8]
MKRIELKFRNEEGRLSTVSLDDPKEPVDPIAVKQAMQVIIDQDVFTSSGGSYVSMDSAQVVDRTVEEISLD